MASKMYECEVLKLFKLPDGTKERRWMVRPVCSLATTGRFSDDARKEAAQSWRCQVQLKAGDEFWSGFAT